MENARTSDRLKPSKRLIQRGRGRIEDRSFPTHAQQLGDQRFLIRIFLDVPFMVSAWRRSSRNASRRPASADPYERMDDRMVISPQHKVSGFVDAAEGAG